MQERTSAQREIACSPLALRASRERSMIGTLEHPELDSDIGSTRSPRPSLRQVLEGIAGLRPGYACWGAEPFDLGQWCHRGRTSVAEVADQEGGRGHGMRRSRTWSRSHVEEHEQAGRTWYAVPTVLHAWGQPQFELHPSWGDLFLDLIYVGCAYQLSSLLSTSFYDCVPEGSSSTGSGERTASTAGNAGSGGSAGSGGGSAGSDGDSGGSSGTDHRLLASTAGTPQPCVGVVVGSLFGAAIFQCIQRPWLTETTFFRCSFCAVDRLHVSLDMLGYFLLIVAAANIGPVQTFLHPQDGGDIRIAGFLLPIWCAQAVWLLRFVEVAVCARDEGARRWGATRAVDDLGVLFGWWGAALLVDLYVDTEFAKEVSIVLMLVGAHWPEARLFWRYVVVRKCLHGKLAPREPVPSGGGGGGGGGEAGAVGSIAEESPDATRTDCSAAATAATATATATATASSAAVGSSAARGERRLRFFPTERTRPPANVEFLIHRFDEFMYLMLGETVLGMILAPRQDGAHLASHYTTELAGFFIVSGMLFSYQVLEPKHSHLHAFRRAYVAGLLYAILYTFKTVAVLFVGISIKLAIYNPTADAHAHFAYQQRLLLGVSLAVCFGLELVMRPLHVGVRHYYSPRTLVKNKKRTLVIAARMVLVGAMGACARVALPPATYLWLQTALTLSACVLAHFQHFTFAQRDVQEYRRRKAERAETRGKLFNNPSSFNIGALG